MNVAWFGSMKIGCYIGGALLAAIYLRISVSACCLMASNAKNEVPRRFRVSRSYDYFYKRVLFLIDR